MPRTQPLSTLFPYTTLFRSREALTVAFCSPPPRPSTTALIGSGMGDALSPVRLWRPRGDLNLDVLPRRRSEEHTSELQSQSNLVCRLLLEKKKEPYNKQDDR